MEFGCLCIASQIWVKQAQPAKYDTEDFAAIQHTDIKLMRHYRALTYKHVCLAWLR